MEKEKDMKDVYLMRKIVVEILQQSTVYGIKPQVALTSLVGNGIEISIQTMGAEETVKWVQDLINNLVEDAKRNKQKAN